MPAGFQLDATSLDALFREARSQNKWQDKPVPDAALQELDDILKWGPNSENCCPARFVFIRIKEGKEKLRPALSSGTTHKTMAAPVTAIIAYDPKFYLGYGVASAVFNRLRRFGLDEVCQLV